MIIAPPPGLMMDQPQVSPVPVWAYGYNVRFRLGLLETLGLFGPMKDPSGDQIILPSDQVYRRVFITLSTAAAQILVGSSDDLQLIDYDPASTPATQTRWRSTSVTPAALPGAVDVVASPSAGVVEIPPVWWFDDADDIVVGCRANVVGEPCYMWDRNRAEVFKPLADSPTGAVGGGIVDRILVLLGCTSFTDPDPSRLMTIRWSDRYNFEDWTPSDINLSGELQLEGGNRIVGGGVTGFGVIAWTDRRMALLSSNPDITVVFNRRYIDGSRGLIANNAWCEADGQVWWFDEGRTLNVFDGGRPRQIPNPIKYATMERLSDGQLARAYLVANPEFGEVILHYPDDDDTEVSSQLVYNYMENVWSIWRLNRTGWGRKLGPIRNTGVDTNGAMWFHDLDTGIPDAYLAGPPRLPGVNSTNGTGTVPPSPGIPTQFPSTGKKISPDDVTPYSFLFGTNLVTTPEVTTVTHRATRLFANYTPLPADGVEDTLTIQLTGYGEASVLASDLTQDARLFPYGVTSQDFRVSGKALQVSLYADDVKTVYRFGNLSATEAKGGAR